MPGEQDRGEAVITALPFTGDVPLTEERRAYLAPRLRALLADFEHLQELEQADGEPAMTFRPWHEALDGPR